MRKTAKKIIKTAPKKAKALSTAKTNAPAAGKKTAPQSGYTAQNITVLEGLEPVRQRPGMYIGSTGSTGLHHLVWEVVDNSLDEAMAGCCSEIIVKILPGNKISVSDNGRGIPVDIHKQYKVSALELVLTKLHAGGKFGGGGYKVSGGLHGVGVSVVNALSSWLKAEVRRDGGIFVQEYALGKPQYKVKQIGKTKDHGTIITFEPDAKTFVETMEFDWKTILDHLRQQAYLTKGIKIAIFDERDKTNLQSYAFFFEGGIASYVRHLNRQQEAKHDNIFYVDKKLNNDLNVEIALRYVEDFKELIYAFANNIYNPEGGMHLAGFRTALTRTINGYARGKGYLKEKDDNLTGEDVREGLTAVISVKLKNPQFEGQTKSKLGNPEVKSAVETIFNESFAAWLEEHPRDAEAIVGRCILTSRARAAAKIARETVIRKGALEGFTLPGKLADCSSRDASISELFIVEGDSAGGCWDGNTKIALVDGRSLSFKELVEENKQGKKNFCYTIQHDGHINIAPILNPRMTKKNAEVIKIILDNNKKLICTPDHLFRLVDGSYIPAFQLTRKHNLAPLYRKKSKKQGGSTLDGYEMVFDPKSKEWFYTHILANIFNLKNKIYMASAGKHRYHLDFNKLNNNPTDIQRLPYKELVIEAAQNFNHKIKKIERIQERMDVYDIEIPETHNFALASGIFVHNSAKQGRNRDNQAILPLRGKILNIERARIDKILTNNELKSLIIAMGTNIGEMFDLSKLRYNRIIIMTDADVDGAHIRTLLLTFFFRHFPQLITQEHIFVAQPPLYKIQSGKEARYAFSDEEKLKIVDEMLKAKGKDAKAKIVVKEENKEDTVAENERDPETTETSGVKINIQRYKGLGEMNPDQLWETTMDPSTRTMRRITIEDVEKADETFVTLMGDEVEPRRRFIQTHAKSVKNLDI